LPQALCVRIFGHSRRGVQTKSWTTTHVIIEVFSETKIGWFQKELGNVYFQYYRTSLQIKSQADFDEL
jgi:hypothetical protein